MHLISKQLHVFDAVVRRQSFTRAARELKMTQPAVTHHMRVLEEMCGVKLVERVGNRVVPTAAGTALHRGARQMIGLDQDLQGVILALRGGERGSLALGANSTGGMYVMLRILRVFRAAYPDVDIHITVADTPGVLAAIADRSIDVGIVRGPVDATHFDVHTLCPDQLVPVASAVDRLAGRAGLTLAELATEPLILPGYGSTTRDFILQRFRDAGIHARIGMEFNVTEHIKTAIEAGLGVGIISRWALQRELDLGILAILDVEGFPLTREYLLVRRRNAPLSAVDERFLAVVNELRPELNFRR